jgi:DNA-binding NarL/FixJ family response regulator
VRTGLRCHPVGAVGASVGNVWGEPFGRVTIGFRPLRRRGDRDQRPTVALVIGERFPSRRVVILTVSQAERDVLDAVAAGAVGYLLKSTAGDSLRNALCRAAAGEPVFSPALASLVLTEFRRLKKVVSSEGSLSEREREVLRYVARGLSYKEIGEELFISAKTVENHTRNILKKLHLSRKQELMRYAIERGIE